MKQGGYTHHCMVGRFEPGRTVCHLVAFYDFMTKARGAWELTATHLGLLPPANFSLSLLWDIPHFDASSQLAL